MKHFVDVLGRILLAFNFLYEAYDSIFYYKETKVKMTHYDLTWNQDLLLISSIVLLLLGGILILIGYRAKFGAICLLIYWLTVTFIAHAYWTFPIEERRAESLFFIKNLAVAGGLFMIWANGVGKYSIKRLFATTKVRGT